MIKSPLIFFCSFSLIAMNQADAASTTKKTDTLGHEQSIKESNKSSDTKQLLLEQVILGEAAFKEELVTQALDRLDKIAPNDPQVIAAHLRQFLRLGKNKLAQQKLDQLKAIAPDSEVYRQAQFNMNLAQPKIQQELQNARILALGGKFTEAQKAYDALFHGNPPTEALAVEYWILMSRIPGHSQESYKHLEDLYRSTQKGSALIIDPNTKRLQDSLKHALANLLVDEGDQALKQGQTNLAQEKYQKAFEFENNNSSVLIGFGDVALERHEYAKAEQDYLKALKIESRITAYYGLVAVYKRQSPQKALDYVHSLPKDVQERMGDYLKNMESNSLQEQAEQLEKNKHLAESIKNYEKALKLTPDDPWLTYRLAKVLHDAGQSQRAITVFQQLAARHPRDPKQVYTYALYLSGIDLDQQAISHINTLPRNLWTSDIRSLSMRLNLELGLDHAQKLRDSGQTLAAIAYLNRMPQSTRIDIKLADWALEDKQYDNALTYYQKVIAREPNNVDAILGKIETLIALKRINEARLLLNSAHQIQSNQSLNVQRRVANAWREVGEPQKANAIFQHLKQLAKRSGVNQDSALIFRNAAQLEEELKEPKLAKEDYRQAMVSSGITPILPPDNDSYTYLTRNQAGDDWLKRGIRSDAAELYRKQDVNFTVDVDYWRLQGTPGFSDLRALDTMAHADFPMWNGRAFLRNDFIKLNAGDFVTDNNGVHFEDFGTCNINGCSTGLSQTATGNSFAAGWANNTWIMDIGTSPLGFPVQNIVGGIGYSGDFNHISWTLLGSRRPITNSLLSFAGTTDPATGIVWGGVVATGPLLALSYDTGGSHGFWGNIEADTLTGKNVVTNQRIRLMDGYYYKFINEDNRRATIGLNNMIWHYQKDLSGYTLGQGGYYSPKSYISLGIPLYYRQRTANWSFEIGGTTSWTWSSSSDSYAYPLSNLSSAIAGNNSFSQGGNSSGLGYTFLFLVERRLTSHFFLGAGVDIQRSRDYTPSHILAYLRYSLDGWQGDMDSPPRPLIPYADYR